MGLYDEHLLTRSTDLQLSLIGATECFLLLFPSVFAGRLLDARRHYYLGFAGFLLLFLGFFLLSFTSRQGLKDQGNYGLVWLTSGLMAGFGMTCFFTYSSHNVIQVHRSLPSYLYKHTRESWQLMYTSGSLGSGTLQLASHQLELE